MAKKKVQALTLEEKLEAALVPDWEQPYKVPDNWIWITAEYGFDITSSKRVHKTDWTNVGIPFYRTRELVVLSETGVVNNELFISENQYMSFKSEYGVPVKEDILISGVGTIGIPYVVSDNNTFYFKDGNIIWFKNRGLFKANYIYYLYKSLFMTNQVKSFSSGTTVDTYTIINANKTMLPLPPLDEQQRIVSRIESLFEKLDRAKELVQSALDSFEIRKAAILHKAFTGELTTKWRADNGVGMDSWDEVTVKDICISLEYGTSKKSDKNGKVVVVRMGNLQKGEIIWDNLAYSNDEDEIEKYKLYAGDVLFNRTNSPELVGKTSIYRGELPAIFAGYLIRLNYIKERVIGDYLNLILNTTNAKEYCKKVKTDGVNQSNINAKKIGAYAFLLPKLSEQQEIVRIINNILKKEQKANELCDIIVQIDLMKKSILARAFRGELGTNDPNEESAIELLKIVLQRQTEEDNKEPTSSKSKPVRISSEVEEMLESSMEHEIYRFIKKNNIVKINEIMGISKKHLEIMDVLRSLENKNLIKKIDSGTYSYIR